LQRVSLCSVVHDVTIRLTEQLLQSSKQQSLSRVIDPIAFAVARSFRPSSSGYFENLELIGDAAERTLLRSRGDAV